MGLSRRQLETEDGFSLEHITSPNRLKLSLFLTSEIQMLRDLSGGISLLGLESLIR